MENKKLAVVILNWNGLELLEQFLPAAVAFTEAPEVDLIVADNGSTDGSLQWIKTNYPNLKTIRFEENYGFAEGYNRAIQETRYPFTVLLNSDVEVTDGWWKPMLEFMEKHPDVGAVAPKIKSFRDREYFEYAGAAGGYLDALGYPYCRGRLFDRTEKDEGQYDGVPVDVCWVSGACLMVRTDVYLKLGGLDPLFFAHMEEIDLCCRMLIGGYRVCAVMDSEVFHVGGASLNQGNPKKTYLNFRNNLLLLYKNLPPAGKKRKIFLRRVVDSLAFFMFLMKGEFGNVKAVLRAHRDYRHMKNNYNSENLPDIPNDFKFPGSQRKIILDRYLLNKKR